MIRLLSRCAVPLALLLGGCDLGPDYLRPEVEMPVQFRATEATGAEAWPSEDWWRGFNSSDLNALIEQARAQNFDIAAAIARIRQADAQVRIAGAAMLPNVTSTAGASWEQAGVTRAGVSGATRGGSTTSTIDIHNYSAGPLNVAYEVDFWGKNRAAQQSAASSAVFSRFDQQVVALTVVTDVANTWFTALALADRLVVAQRNLADSEQTMAVIRGRLFWAMQQKRPIVHMRRVIARELVHRNDLRTAALGTQVYIPWLAYCLICGRSALVPVKSRTRRSKVLLHIDEDGVNRALAAGHAGAVDDYASSLRILPDAVSFG